MKYLHYFIDKHRLVNIISLILIVLGMVSLKSTNVDLIPPMNFKGITVNFSYPEATTGDMEEYVVFPFEEKISNFSGLKSFSSVSRNGSARVSLNFPANFQNMNGALAEVKSILEELKPNLPQGIRSISVKENKENKAFQNYISLTGVDLKSVEHNNIIKGFENSLKNIRGVIEVQDQRPKKNLEIDFNESKLKEKELTVSDVLSSIRTYLQYVPLGSIKKGNNRTIIEFEKYSEEGFLRKLQDLPVKGNSFGYVTRLKDVADVSYKFEKRDYTTFFDKVPVYGFRVSKDLNSDVLKIDEKVREELVEFNKNTLGLKAVSTISGKGFISRQLRALKSNGIFGIILVSMLLIAFLSWRSALCAVWGVPIAYAGTFFLIYAMGMSINLLSVVGLIIVAGILVDDALIVTEKYNEELEKGKKPYDAAKAAVDDLFLPVLGTALTTIVAFLPLILIPSEMGEILKSIPIVIIAAIFFSLFESFCILPSHLVSFDKKYKQNRFNNLFDSLKRKYAALIRFSLKYKYSTVLSFVVFSIGAFYYSMDVEKNFNLNIGDEFVMVRGALLESNSKAETLDETEELYAFVRKVSDREEVVSVDLGIGKQWSFTEELFGEKYFTMKIMIDESYSQPEQIKAELEKQLKSYIDDNKEDHKKYEFLNVQRNYAGAEGKSDQKYLSINFYTKTSGVNLDLKKILSSIPEQIEDLGEIELGDDAKKVTKWVFDPDYKLLSQLNISKEQIKNSVLGKMQQSWIGESRVNGDALPIVTTIGGKSFEHNDFKPNEHFVITDTGTKVYLSTLGRWKQTYGPEKIKHLNAYKVQTAKFPIKDNTKRDAIVKKSKEVVKEINKKYPQYIIKSSGESVQEAENKEWVLNALIACILGIYFILVLVLGSFSQPVIVCLPILFGIIGVLLAHKLHGMALGVFSGVGLVGAIGVSVNGSLVMADQINTKFKEAKEGLYGAIVSGALSRFRAIVLTTLTTLGGLFPMAYGLGGDSGFTKALAFSMAWGIALASILTLFFFPAIFAVLRSTSDKTSDLWERAKSKLDSLIFNSTQ